MAPNHAPDGLGAAGQVGLATSLSLPAAPASPGKRARGDDSGASPPAAKKPAPLDRRPSAPAALARRDSALVPTHMTERQMLQLALEESRRAAAGPGAPASPSAAASPKPRAPRPPAPRPPRRPASPRTPGGLQAAKGSRAAATPATAGAPRARRVDGSDDDDDEAGALATPRFGRLLPPRPPPACARVPPLASALAALRVLDSGGGHGCGVLVPSPHHHPASTSSAASDGDRAGARSPSPLSPRSAASSSSSMAAAAAAAAAARAPSVADSLAETLAADAAALRAVHAAEGGRLLDDGCWTAAGRGGRWAAAPACVRAPPTLPPSRLGKARLAGAAAAPTHAAAGSFAAACAALSSRLLLRTTARAWDDDGDGGSEWTRDVEGGADAHATPDPADDALARQSLEAATLDALRRWLGRDG